MNTGYYKGLKDEELVELYKSGDERAFEALLKSTEKIRYSLANNYLNIPGSEIEDLMSEGAMEMLKAIWKYDSTKYTVSFKSFLYTDLTQRYNDMFKAAVNVKRNPKGFVESFEQLNSNSEFEEEGDTLGNREFSVECEDYSMVEIRMLMDSLKLSAKERVVINLLMDGNSKPDIARRLGVSTPSVHTYIKRIGQKVNLSGAFA